MKTKMISLEKALKLAPEGPLKFTYTSAAAARKARLAEGCNTDGGGADGCIYIGSGLAHRNVAFLAHHRDPAEDKQRGVNAALIVHARNVLREVVAALSESLDIGDNVCGCGKCGGCLALVKLRGVLDKASKVEVPK